MRRALMIVFSAFLIGITSSVALAEIPMPERNFSVFLEPGDCLTTVMAKNNCHPRRMVEVMMLSGIKFEDLRRLPVGTEIVFPKYLSEPRGRLEDPEIWDVSLELLRRDAKLNLQSVSAIQEETGTSVPVEVRVSTVPMPMPVDSAATTAPVVAEEATPPPPAKDPQPPQQNVIVVGGTWKTAAGALALVGTVFAMLFFAMWGRYRSLKARVFELPPDTMTMEYYLRSYVFVRIGYAQGSDGKPEGTYACNDCGARDIKGHNLLDHLQHAQPHEAARVVQGLRLVADAG